jgi:NTE family protein
MDPGPAAGYNACVTEEGRAVDDFLDDSEVFGALPLDVRRALGDLLLPVSIEGGDVLMREGDEPDGLYLLRAGRLQARVGEGDELVVLGEIGRGEVVGESALLTDQRRSATVVALRDSELLHLPVAAFERLVGDHPGFLRPITAQVVRRMLQAQRRPTGSRPVSTVAVLTLHPTAVAVDVSGDLADALVGVMGRAVILQHDDGTDGRTEVERAQAIEADHDLVVYRSGPEVDDWTRRSLRQADAVVLVADAGEQPVLTGIEELVAERQKAVEAPVELVLAHPYEREAPHGTRHWLLPRSVRRHHHVRAGDARDAARVARLVTNQGIGLVLSGGGARSMAEIGVVRAMHELGIPIDAVGGTSAGALVAGAVARGWPVDRITSVLHRGMVEGPNPVDFTVPFTSLAAGRRMTDRLREAAGEIDIEDLWLDYFCVSTNLSRNAAKIHRRGRGWRAVRASMSIPGVFPPVADDGDVLVDGGLVDNLPVGEMRRGHDGITVVAVDVGVHRGMSAGDLPDSTVVHGWRLVLDRLHPRRRSPRIAGILTVLSRLTELGGGKASVHEDGGEVLVRPDVERFPMLDFSRFDALVEVGHAEGLAVLGPWWEEQRRVA